MVNGVTIKEGQVKSVGGMVILPVKEYRRLIEQDVPTYYLKGKAATNLDKLVAEGLKEYREGKTIKANSMSEALKIYAKRKGH
ncbi:MAG TPA: hypothetical protein VJG48_01270 [Candidatus Paceibacterota bacterium]